jgi:hypothetical protein
MDENQEQRRKSDIFTWVVIIAATFFLAVLFIPGLFPRAHGFSAANGCVNNLRQIDAAASQFALEHGLTNGAPIDFPNDLTPYISSKYLTNAIHCPAGGVYHISKVGEVPTCSLGSTITPNHILP